DINTLARQPYALDVEAAIERGADLAGRRIAAVELFLHVAQDRVEPVVLQVHRNELDPGVAQQPEQARERQKPDEGDTGLLAPECAYSMLLPMRLHCGPPSLGQRQFIQIRSARPTR